MTILRTVRYALWACVAAAVAFSAAVWSGWIQLPRPSLDRNVSTVSFGGPFALISHKGETFTEANLKGKPYALFFGFTHCPDICPTTLWELSELMKQLGSDADKLLVVFVTVDPERDTLNVIAEYLTSFDPRIVGLTGEPQQIDAMTKLYRAYYKKVSTNDGEYTMDHTAVVYMMDGEGRFSSTLDRHESSEIQMQKLRRLATKAY